ncbi:hypothetical protein ACUN24_09235 [Pedobacter sp. WC2501]|uniref:hypothetical protein n=1 Tax=Pedobacter sp. WC2501 TaxID=3461400 RepID=UPI004045638A
MTLEDDHLGEPEDYRNLKDYIETKKWLAKKLKKPHRTFTLTEMVLKEPLMHFHREQFGLEADKSIYNFTHS